MSRVQPHTLTNEELLRHMYIENYNVPTEFVQELCNRLAYLMDTVEDDNK